MKAKTQTTKDKELIPLKSSAETLKSLELIRTEYEPEQVLKEVGEELDYSQSKQAAEMDSVVYKALTLHEFDKGILMNQSIPKHYHTFAIDTLRKLQKEFHCNNVSEKGLAEVIVINFIRTIEIQRKINNYLNIGTFTQTGVNYLNVLSKELDRANRHYLTALQALKSIKHPDFKVNIKTQTAVVGQNQLVQSNNK